MSSVKLTQTIDDREVVKAFQKQHQLLDKLSRNLDRVGKKGGQAGKQTKREFDSATGSALKFAAAITGVGSVVGAIGIAARQLRTELENIRSRQREAANAQLSLAEVQKAAFQNVLPNQVPTLRAAIARLSEQTGVTQRDLTPAVGTAVSFKGALPLKTALNAVGIAAQLSSKPDAIKDIAKGLLSQKQLAGGTLKDIAGFQLLVKNASPISTAGSFASTISPAIGGLVQQGNTPRDAAAFLAAFGQSIGDETGQRTATGAPNFGNQLKIALPNVKGGIFGRLDFLRSPEGARIRRRLLGPFQRSLRQAKQNAASGRPGLTGEARNFATLVELLQPTSNKTQQLFAATRAKIPAVAGSGGFLDKLVGAINSDPLQQTAEFKRRLVAGKERLRVNAIREGRVGIGRDELRALLKASGSSSIDQTISGLQFDFSTAAGTLPVAEVVAQLRERARILRSPTGGPTTLSVSPGAPPPGFQGGAVPLPTKSASATDLQTAGILSQIADTLRSIDVKTQPAQQHSRPPASKSLSRN